MHNLANYNDIFDNLKYYFVNNMTKYIISNGFSVVTMLAEDSEKTSIELTTKVENSIKFDTIGEAMYNASKVNKILGGTNYHALSIKVNEN